MFFSKVFTSVMGLVGWAAAQCMGMNVFFVVPDAIDTEIFWAPVQSCLVMGPVTPKYVSGLQGCQWDLARAAHKHVVKVGAPSPPSGCFLQ